MLIQKSTFVVKQSSGFMRSFLYIDKVGIVERIFKRSGWSKYDVFIKNAHKNFAVVLFPDDEINIIFRDNQGNIFLATYNNSEPIIHQLYKNIDSDDIYIDAYNDENEIHIFYTMTNKRTDLKTIFYQRIDRELNVSPIDIIGTTAYNYEQPFVIYNSGRGNIYVAYQRDKENRHFLGYKMLDAEQRVWTKYRVIDESNEPFIDFSLIQVDCGISGVYIKKEDSSNKVMYFSDNGLDKRQYLLYEDSNILSCSMFIRGSNVWCTWMNRDKLYGVFKLLKDTDFSSPPYEEIIKSEIISKGYYLCNYAEDTGNFPNGEFYILNNSGPDYHVLPKIYNTESRSKNTSESFAGYISDQVLKKMQWYIDEIKEKDKIIEELREKLARLESINEGYSSVVDGEHLEEQVEIQQEENKEIS